MHHSVFGAAIPLAIVLLILAIRRGRASLPMLLLTPPAMAFGALWAMLPDLPRLLGWHSLYRHLAEDPRTDIFLFHYTLDRIEARFLDDLGPLFNILFAAMMLLVLFIAWRELKHAEASPPH